MPLHEDIPAKVTVIVEVDGHVLTFVEAARRVAGARYHGADNRGIGGMTKGEVLEASIRVAVDGGAERAVARAREAVRRLYPVHGEPAGEAP